MKKKAFTLIELLVVIAIIALLVSILLPSLNRAKGLAKKTVCLAHIKGIGLCAMMYADANNDFLPSAKYVYDAAGVTIHWYQALAPYAGEPTDQNSYDYAELFEGCPEFIPQPGSLWNSGYGAVIMIQSYPDGTKPTGETSYYRNWKPLGETYGVNGDHTNLYFKRNDFSDSIRRGWFGDSPGWHIGGGPTTESEYDPDNRVYPTWCKPSTQGGWGLGNDPERHVDSSNIWFLDGHAKDYKYNVGGNAFYDIEKLPF